MLPRWPSIFNVVRASQEGHEALRVAECLWTISFGQARSSRGLNSPVTVYADRPIKGCEPKMSLSTLSTRTVRGSANR